MENLDRLNTPPQLARLIVSVLEEEGINPNQLLHGTGLSAQTLGEMEDNISYRQMLSLIHRALDLSAIPALGLRVGARESISTWGMLGYALMSSATERQAIELGAQFQRASSSILTFSLHEEPDAMRVELEHPVPLGHALPFSVEEMIAGICTVTPVILGHPIELQAVSLTYAAPSYSALYDDFFRCPISYNQPINAYWTARPTDRPLQHADPGSAALCLKLVEQVVQRNSAADDLVISIRKLLLQNPSRPPDMETIAVHLAMSSRTLRRKLDTLGTSFRKIVDEVRKDLALDYLATSDLTIDQIAGFLGYTETTNFRRAFKQWTGKPPSHFR